MILFLLFGSLSKTDESMFQNDNELEERDNEGNGEGEEDSYSSR